MHVCVCVHVHVCVCAYMCVLVPHPLLMFNALFAVCVCVHTFVPSHNPLLPLLPSPSPFPTHHSHHAGKKKFPGMSPKMLLRVGQWESQTTIPATVTSPSRNVSSGGRGLIPLASSTHSNGEPTLRANTTPSGADGATKRYSFQPKTLSPSSSSSSLPPRSMSVDQRPVSSGSGSGSGSSAAAGGVRGSLFPR